MGQIDEISQLLGSIDSSIKHILGKTEAIDQKVEKLQEDSVAAKITTKAAHKRLDEIEPKVVQHEALRNKGLGIVAFIGFLFGTVGAFLGKILAALN